MAVWVCSSRVGWAGTFKGQRVGTLWEVGVPTMCLLRFGGIGYEQNMSLAHGASILSEGDTVNNKQPPVYTYHVSNGSKAKKKIMSEMNRE